MFIDMSTYVGHWPFRNIRYNTLEGLDTLAQKYEITHMVVSNINGFFYKDSNTAKLELLQWLKNYQGKTQFLPLAVVNPRYPTWEKDARDMIAAGFVGFEIAPVYHGYSMAPEIVFDHFNPIHYGKLVLDLAEELDVPVRICSSIEDFRGRGEMDPKNNITGDEYYALLSANTNTHVFATSFPPEKSGDRLSALLKTRKNTYFDLTLFDPFWGIGCDPVNNVVAPEQLAYGSLSPFNYMECSLLRGFYGEFDFEAMKTNAARAFKSLRG